MLISSLLTSWLAENPTMTAEALLADPDIEVQLKPSLQQQEDEKAAKLP